MPIISMNNHMPPETYPHPPGSPAAVQDGCTCPQMDNHRGQGNGYVDSEGAPMYWYDLACPLHGNLESVPPETLCYKATAMEAEK